MAPTSTTNVSDAPSLPTKAISYASGASTSATIATGASSDYPGSGDNTSVSSANSHADVDEDAEGSTSSMDASDNSDKNVSRRNGSMSMSTQDYSAYVGCVMDESANDTNSKSKINTKTSAKKVDTNMDVSHVSYRGGELNEGKEDVWEKKQGGRRASSGAAKASDSTTRMHQDVLAKQRGRGAATAGIAASRPDASRFSATSTRTSTKRSPSSKRDLLSKENARHSARYSHRPGAVAVSGGSGDGSSSPVVRRNTTTLSLSSKQQHRGGGSATQRPGAVACTSAIRSSAKPGAQFVAEELNLLENTRLAAIITKEGAAAGAASASSSPSSRRLPSRGGSSMSRMGSSSRLSVAQLEEDASDRMASSSRRLANGMGGSSKRAGGMRRMGSSSRLSVAQLEDASDRMSNGAPSSSRRNQDGRTKGRPSTTTKTGQRSSADYTDDDRKPAAKLAEARLVEEDEAPVAVAGMVTTHADGEVDLEEQQRHEDRQEETRRKHTAWSYKVWAVFCLVLVGIAVGTYFAVRPGSDEAMTTDEMANASPSLYRPSLAPSLAPTRHIIDLPVSTMETILRDPDSPQAKAYEWLCNDPFLDLYVDDQEFRLHQRYALATIYYALDGENWYLQSGWMNYAVNECDWDFKGGYGLPAMEIRGLVVSTLVSMIVSHAVTGEPFDWSDFVYVADRPSWPPPPICNPKNEFKLLKIHKNNVYGSIPEEIAMISSLALMDISYNDGLIGTIPNSFGLMQQMKYIMMEETGITGRIPSEIGDMRCMRILSTSGTRFSKGTTIPTEIGQLKELKALLIPFSGIEGAIPSELGAMAGNLTILDVSSRSDDEDFIVGAIPSELGLLTNLHVFTCGNCQLEGTLPSQLGQLAELEMLSVGPSNDLVGTIPTSFGGLTSLKYAQISRSQLTGQIPSELGLSTDLVRMYLMGNQLTSTLPSELGKMTNLESVRINGNPGLTGTIPAEIVVGWGESLVSLNISDTLITGTMSPSFCSLPGFFEFECSGNETCGCDCCCISP